MLQKLYSETNLITGITFRSGINIVMGSYSLDKKEKKGINGIGKSTLVRLIGFLMLSDSAENYFYQKKFDFLRKESHTISLIFKIKGSNHHITRDFIKKSDILFGTSKYRKQRYNRSELRNLLGGLLFPMDNSDAYIEGNRIGTLMKFFIKDDLDHLKRFDPIEFYNHYASVQERFMYNFFLMNLPTHNLIKFNHTIKQYHKSRNATKELEKKVKEESGFDSIEALKSNKLRIEKEITTFEDSIQNFKFSQSLNLLEEKISKLSQQINELHLKHHDYEIKLIKIRESFDDSIEVNVENVKRIYNEAAENLGNIILTKIEDVIKFNNEIISNRKKFLREREIHFEAKLDEILREINTLDDERSRLYGILKKDGALDIIEQTFQELMTQKIELADQMKSVNQINEFQKNIADLEVQISSLKKDLIDDIQDNLETINELREIYDKILHSVIEKKDNKDDLGHFGIKIISNSKKIFLPLKIEVAISKAEALGQARLKIVVYDLMVFFFNLRHKRNLPNFLIHDGVYHGISLETTLKTLQFINKQELEGNKFQYIVTFNEDELIPPTTKQDLFKDIDFDKKQYTIIELSDIPNKMLFKKNF